MVALVSVDRVKEGLHIDSDDDDILLEFYIEAASRLVVWYLKDQAEVVLDLDSGGDLVSGSEVPAGVEMATLMQVGYFYRAPDINPENAYSMGYLPAPVTALLYMIRDPELK